MGVAAGVADDDNVVVQIAGCVDGRGDADVDGSAGNDQRIDAARAQCQIEVGLMKGVPAVFGDDVVLRTRRDLFDDFCSQEPSVAPCTVGLQSLLAQGRKRISVSVIIILLLSPSTR